MRQHILGEEFVKEMLQIAEDMKKDLKKLGYSEAQIKASIQMFLQGANIQEEGK